MSEENKAVVRRLFEEAWNQGNLAVVDELFAPDYVGHIPPEILNGPEAFKQFVKEYRTVFPDIHFTIEDLVAEGDKVVGRWTCRGTHKGELQGIPATGVQVTSTGIHVSRIAGGKIVEAWSNWDAMGVMQQLSAASESGQAKGTAAG